MTAYADPDDISQKTDGKCNLFLDDNVGFPAYLVTLIVPSSRVRLLVIAMIIFLQVSRSLAEPHSSENVQFVTALMSSSQRARGLPLFLEPPPIPNIIDFSKLFSLRMICPKYDNCCFFINVSNGLAALISSITDLLVHLAVHGIHSSLLQHHNSKLSILLLSAFRIVQDSQPYSTTGKTNAFTILHFVVIVISLSFHILSSPVIATLPNANRLKMSPLQEPESSMVAPRKIKYRRPTTPVSPSTSHSSISSVDMILVFFRFK